MKYIVFAVLSLLIVACSQNNKSEKAEMYEASELAQLMRDMVAFSENAKTKLAAGEKIDSIPAQIWDLKKVHGTRDEHLESAFQDLSNPYLEALKGIERGDSQQFYYTQSIEACKSCHGVYCGGPLLKINQL
ncbi:MAG: hypothetical protein RLZZ337_968 [Bacteroidota bacterium]